MGGGTVALNENNVTVNTKNGGAVALNKNHVKIKRVLI